MIRGLYTAASGMLAMQRRQESLANNLANINTAGYKQDDGVIRSFPEQLISRIRDKEGPDIAGLPNFTNQSVMIGRLNTGVYMSEALPLFTQGDIMQTDEAYDLALTDNLPPVEVDGKQVKRSLFFSVAKLDDPAQPAGPDDVRYTRNGQLSVNAAGYLVNADGYYLLDNQNRAIRINGVVDANGDIINAARNVKITPLGDVLIPDPNAPDSYQRINPNENVQVGLKVVTDPHQLIREGNNVFRWAGQAELTNAADDPTLNGYYAIRQGWVERSNVDASQTVTDMMVALRSYEANQRMLTTLDSTLEKAVNEIGKVSG